MKQKRKMVLTLTLTLVLLLAAVAPASAMVYMDTDGHWAQEEIDVMSDAHIIFSIGRFSPDEPITRGDMAIALWQIFRKEWTEEAENMFTDISSYDQAYGNDAPEWYPWYATYTAMLRANHEGVILGEGTELRPAASLSREEAAVMLCRAFSIKSSGERGKFTDDSSISDWAREAVYTLAAAGYLKGFDDGSFRPKREISRAEVASVLYRMKEQYPQIKERLAESGRYSMDPKTAEWVDYTVASEPVYPGGVNKGYFQAENASADMSQKPCGTKDINFRLWMPENTEKPVPILLYIHGGAWMEESYDEFYDWDLLNWCLDHGIALASCEYRLSVEAIWPAALHDLKGTIRYIRAHAGELGIDENSIGITGYSAGGQLVMILGTSGDVPELEGVVGGNTEYSSRVDYVWSDCGVGSMMDCHTDVDYRVVNPWASSNLQHDSKNGAEAMLFGLDRLGVTLADIRDVYAKGDKSDPLWKTAMLITTSEAIRYIDPKDPDFFIYTATEDTLCPLQNNLDFYGALCAAGVNATIRAGAYAAHCDRTAQYEAEIYEWILQEAFKFAK